MKLHTCIQGSEEWLRLRIGRPTASEFDRVITPKKWEPTSGAARRGYAVKLITELALNCSLDEVTTAAMQSGHDWEPKARAAYEAMYGVDVDLCGFCTTDDGSIGASPDGMVGEDGEVEIKSPFKPEIHMANVLDPKGFEQDHWVQSQGQLYVTGRKWNDLVSYFGGLPMVVVRMTPHAEFQEKLDKALKSFLCELTDLLEVAKKAGVVFPDRAELDAPLPSKDWITEEDVDAILAGRKA